MLGDEQKNQAGSCENDSAQGAVYCAKLRPTRPARSRRWGKTRKCVLPEASLDRFHLGERGRDVFLYSPFRLHQAHDTTLVRRSLPAPATALARVLVEVSHLRDVRVQRVSHDFARDIILLCIFKKYHGSIL